MNLLAATALSLNQHHAERPAAFPQRISRILHRLRTRRSSRAARVITGSDDHTTGREFKEAPTMTTWSKDELRRIAQADDLHISPFREDGVRK